jgi:cytochrome c oxidase subunit 4
MSEHGKSEHSHGEHDELAHALPVSLLCGILFVLLVLTGLTVYIADLGLGSRASFMIAMVIATVKAGMVMAVFMHLWWDKRLNVLAFLGAFLFLMLFIGMSLTDKSEYAPDIKKLLDAQAAQK